MGLDALREARRRLGIPEPKRLGDLVTDTYGGSDTAPPPTTPTAPTTLTTPTDTNAPNSTISSILGTIGKAAPTLAGPLPSVVRELYNDLSAFTTGFYRDPLVRVIAKSHILPLRPMDEATLADMERKVDLAGGRQALLANLGQVAALIGPGIGSFSMFRIGARELASVASKEAASFLTATAAKDVLVKPTALRVAETIGGSLGIGSETTARSLSEGDDAKTALRRGAKSAALTFALESTLTKMLGSTGDPRKLLARQGEEIGAFGEGQVAKRAATIERRNETITTLNEKLNERAAELGWQRPALITDPEYTGNLEKLRRASRKADRLRVLQRAEGAPAVERMRALANYMADEAEDAARAVGVKLGAANQKLSTLREKMSAKLTKAFQASRSAREAVDNSTNYRHLTAKQALETIEENTAKSERWWRARVVGAEKRAGRLSEKRASLLSKAAAARRFGDPETDPNLSTYLRDSPTPADILVGGVYLPTTLTKAARTANNVWRKVRAQTLTSPQTLGRKGGVTFNKATELITQSDNIRARLVLGYESVLLKDFRDLARAMNTPLLQRLRGGRFATGVRDAWEKGRLPAVEDKYGPEVANIWGRMMATKNAAHSLAEEIGALPPMSDDFLAHVGLPGGAHFPQVMRRIGASARSRERLISGVMANQKVGRAEAEYILDQLAANAGEGLPKIGNIDIHRLLKGSTSDKLSSGIELVDDPLEALARYYEGIAHRVAVGGRWGTNGELKTLVLDGIGQEGGDQATARVLIDSALGHKYWDQAMGKAARLFTNYQILAKLGLATIPNSTQSIANIIINGHRGSLRGLQSMLTREGKEEVLQSLAVMDGTNSSIQNVLLSRVGTAPLDKVVRGFLKGILFDPIEKFNRTFTGASSLATIRRDVELAMAGRLRGNNLAIASRRAGALGLDIDTMVANGGLSETDIINAVYNGAQRTQFIPGAGRLPTLWNTPTGRVITQFKSFAFNQAKLIKDGVFREAAHGNMKPLASFLTYYPIAGDIVNKAVSEVLQTGRFKGNIIEEVARHGIVNSLDRYVFDMAAVGTMGLYWTMLLSGIMFDRPLESLLGPSVSDLSAVTRNLDSVPGLAREAARQPTFRLGKALLDFGEGASDRVQDLLGQTRQSSAGGLSAVVPMSDYANQVRSTVGRTSTTRPNLTYLQAAKDALELPRNPKRKGKGK